MCASVCSMSAHRCNRYCLSCGKIATAKKENKAKNRQTKSRRFKEEEEEETNCLKSTAIFDFIVL